ncbi:LysE family translocator [Chitinophaga arvensicola]|uniref:Threonine/homoserine/homoserine lactone efflux protein n=1 Tax=Chitinophaga arvensicola TaxID=29529 RepID=A0A1I0NSX2_9BACT|nr:LysE family transporter [Chitinophaga arvensicola]SEW04729.1 Threonine/homoserine/homoserine lactone efflux protein [Chitinophaga arvensicola]
MIAAIVAGLGLGLVLSVSVGPVIFAIIKYSVNNGFKAGISFALGVSFSDIMFVLIGNISTAFISGLEGYNRTIGVVGGVLLIGMGIYGLLFKKVKISTGEEKPEMFGTHDYLKIWLAGFLMNTLNPGVVIFWLPVCIGYSATSISHRIVMYGVCLSMVLSADIMKVFVSDKLRHKLTLKNVEWLNRIAGVSMIIFGLVLLYKVLFDVGSMGH